MEEISDHLYEANHTWIKSVRNHLRQSVLDGLTESSKSSSFLSFPIPECSCLRSEPKEASHRAAATTTAPLPAALRVAHPCPAWMGQDAASRPGDKENEDDLDEDDSGRFGLFFRQSSVAGGRNHEGGGGRGGGELMSSKEETQMEDQEEMDGGDR